MVFADIQPRDEWDTEGSEGRPNDRQMEEAHFHRLEQILGGKTKRDVEKTMYETTIGLEPTISNLMIDGEYTCKHYSKGSLQIDKEQQENRGSIQELQKNACSTNNQHPEYEGLELAMKQLIEVTQNALVDMKTENGKVGSKNVEYYPIKYEQRAALNEEMLRRVSSHRLERSVAAVRGWLQSPTPSEESSIIGCRDSVPCQFQQKVSNLSTPNLFTSFKEEEELNPLHQHAKSFPRPFVKNDKDSCAFYSLDIKEALTKS